MKKILFLILTLVISSLMIGCGGSSSSDDHTYKSVTVLYCGIGDEAGSEDLSEDIIGDIKSFSKYSNNKKVKVLCEFKLNNSKDIRRGLVSECGADWKNYPVISQAKLGYGETLREFIEYGQKNYPSDEYVLILSSHGNGYDSSETKACIYGNDNSYLANGILGEVCKPYNINACIYDCSLMGCLENYTCAKDAFDYIIATASKIDKYNKALLMEKLIYHDNMEYALKEFSRELYDYCQGTTHICFVKCEVLTAVLYSVNRIATFLVDYYDEYDKEIAIAKANTVPINKDTQIYDFIDVCEKISKEINNNEFQQLIKEYKEACNDAMIFNGKIKGTAMQGPANGFSIVYPNKSEWITEYQKNYPQTNFAKTTGWDKFLEKINTK